MQQIENAPGTNKRALIVAAIIIIMLGAYFGTKKPATGSLVAQSGQVTFTRITQSCFGTRRYQWVLRPEAPIPLSGGQSRIPCGRHERKWQVTTNNGRGRCIAIGKKIRLRKVMERVRLGEEFTIEW